ncbi:MAG TPA: MG2 domain-containing protein [Polyangia bacterium]|nr:MG2 domain-containing protein [Polyangia bacterium]
MKRWSLGGVCAALGTFALVFFLDAAQAAGPTPQASASASATPPRGARLGTYVRGSTRMSPGSQASLRVLAHWTTGEAVTGPLAHAAITVELETPRRSHLLLWRGATDEQGSAAVRFEVPRLPAGSYTLTVETRAGIGSQRHTHTVEILPTARVRLESDKPLYQPGQTIHLRALGLDAIGLHPLASRPARFELLDPRGNRVHLVEARTSAFGVAAADLLLGDEILLGAYRARVTLDEPARTAAEPQRPRNGGDGDDSTEIAAPVGELTLTVDRYQLPKFQVSLNADRPWYAPGDRVRLSLAAQYFFGKPVARAGVTVHVEAVGTSGARAPVVTLRGRTDEAGRVPLEFDTPRGLADGATLRLAAEVVDEAEHTEHTARDLAVALGTLRLDAIAESAALVPGLPNRVFLVATRPDGAPAAGVALAGQIGGQIVHATTDEIGLATVTLPGVHPGPGCSGVEIPVRLEATAGAGERAQLQRCLPLDPSGSLLVRADHALYAPGAPITVEILSTRGPAAYLDVVKEGQLLTSAVVPLIGGAGRITLAGDPARCGTLALRAYRIDPDGRQAHDVRLIYVPRPERLTVTATPDQASYQPGARGRIHLHVSDAGGRGLPASLGVVMVDESVLALRAVPAQATELYFMLAREATHPTLALRHTPGGYTMERLVSEDRLDPLRDEAAQALLAGASPPWTTAWEIDPWQLRDAAWQRQRDELTEAIRRWSRFHNVGTLRTSQRTWRWRSTLLDELIAAGALDGDLRRDPWGRGVTLAQAVESLDGETLAEEATWQRLEVLYTARARHAPALLSPDPFARETSRPPQRRKRTPYLLGDNDLARLAAQAVLPPGVMVDPWGRPWRLKTLARPVLVSDFYSRTLLTSLGPDGRPDSGDDLMLYTPGYPRLSASVQGGVLGGEVFGAGGLGLMGAGRGGGGAAFGMATAAPATEGAMGRDGTALDRLVSRSTTESTGEGQAPARVRESFPETMLWRPAVLTDAHGDATLEVDMADSITTWRLLAQAVDAAGHLGAGEARVRVFQDFFVDLDLPPAITQHDELSVPVAVYNYLPGAAHIRLELAEAEGFTLLGEGTQEIDLGPSQVGVRHFRVRAERIGRRGLLVRAVGTAGTAFADAVRRTVEIFPDGVERNLAFSDRLDGTTAPAHELHVPEGALADASRVDLKLYPSMATHVIEGLDSMLRMPGGCFEQTSSTNYPNALILDYLQRTHTARPEVERRAREYLTVGYQRLLSFEVQGGGFSWFGDAPAHQILTAYGLQEFYDMARVHPVDPRVIERTRRWLIARQRPDGSWAPDTRFINEGATDHFNSDVTRITAYIALSLARTGHGRPEVGAAVARAVQYLSHHLGGVTDPYTLALAGALLGEPRDPAGLPHEARSTSGDRDDRALLGPILDRLWAQRQETKAGVSFSAAAKTLTYGDGRSGTVETTALAAQALLDGHAPLGHIERAVTYLLGAKDSFGNWYSTQATILSLKALLAWQERGTRPGRGLLHVDVDGVEVTSAPVDTTADLLQQIALPQVALPGPRPHRIRLRYAGSGSIGYQLVARWYEPRLARATAPGPVPATAATDEDLTVRVGYDRTTLGLGESTTATVHVASRAAKPADMPIVTVGLPPGLDVDPEDFERLVREHVVAKVQRGAREAIFYLTHLAPGQTLSFHYRLRPRFPVQVQAPAATIYEYYRPEHRASDAPILLTVHG